MIYKRTAFLAEMITDSKPRCGSPSFRLWLGVFKVSGVAGGIHCVRGVVMVIGFLVLLGCLSGCVFLGDRLQFVSLILYASVLVWVLGMGAQAVAWVKDVWTEASVVIRFPTSDGAIASFDAANRSEGEGSDSDWEGSEGVPSSVRKEVSPAGSLRILLAEDNILNQQVTVIQLTRLGYHVEVVANGCEAVDRATEESFDLILMDCQMPGLDGFEATREIRSRGNKVPIVAMTASAMAGDRERCLASGMDDYLSKPVSWDDLERILKRRLVLSGSSACSTISAVDHVRLHEITAGYDGLRDDLVADYLGQADDILGEIQGAICNQDSEAVRRLAHKLRGSSAICGMTAINGPLERLESDPSNQSNRLILDECWDALGRIRRELAEVGGF